MKKIWKLSVCALSATFTLSAVTACGDDAETKSNITPDQVFALTESVVESLEGTKSLEFGLSASMSMTEGTYKEEESAEYTGLISIEGEYAEDINAKFVGKEYSSMPVDEYFYGLDVTDNIKRSSTSSTYIIDGYQYDASSASYEYPKALEGTYYESVLENYFGTESGDINEYYKSPYTSIESEIGSYTSVEDYIGEFIEEFDAVMEEMETPSFVTDLIKQTMTKEFLLVQSGNTTRITLDLGSDVVNILNYAGSLKTTTKVGDVINYSLGHVEQGLTWQKIANDIKDKGDYTVREAVDTLDTELRKSFDLNVQDLKDAVIDEMYSDLIYEIGYEETNMIRDMQVEEFVAEYGSYTINDWLSIYEGEDVTLEDKVDEYTELLNEKTLGDYMTEEDEEEFNEMINTIKSIKVGALNANIVLTTNGKKTTRVECSYNVSVSAKIDGEAYAVNSKLVAYAQGFSTQTQRIALPENATIVNS